MRTDAGQAHSILGGTAWETTPWRAVQRAARDVAADAGSGELIRWSARPLFEVGQEALDAVAASREDRSHLHVGQLAACLLDGVDGRAVQKDGIAEGHGHRRVQEVERVVV